MDRFRILPATVSPIQQSNLHLMTITAVLFVMISCFAGGVGAQENWPRFRGDNGAGTSHAANIPVEWTAADYNWRTKLPGGGNSSPVVWGDRVFIQTANSDASSCDVVCIDAISGKEIWKREFEVPHYPMHTRNTSASSTPVVDDKHVYAVWATPEKISLLAFTHDGDPAWKTDLGSWVGVHGFGVSPIVYEDLVIVANSQQARKLKNGQLPGISSVIAVHRMTGKEVWKSPRGGDICSYSVPCIYRGPSGKDELIGCSTADGAFSLDPKTGTQNWSLPGLYRQRTVASPVISEGLLLTSNGSGGGGNYLVAIDLNGKQPVEKFRIKRHANYVPTPIFHNGRIFLWHDSSFVHCVSKVDGKTIWTQRLEGEFSGSPVLVQDRMYCIADSGDVFVVGTGEKFELLAVNPLGESSRSTPAIANGKMFLRTDTHLISIGG